MGLMSLVVTLPMFKVEPEAEEPRLALGDDLSQFCTDEQTDDDADDEQNAEDEEQPQVGIFVFLPKAADASAKPACTLFGLLHHLDRARDVGLPTTDTSHRRGRLAYRGWCLVAGVR